MKKYFVRWFVGMAVILGVSVAVFAAPALEKKQWRVELTPAGGLIPHFIDRFRFEDKNFASVIFERKGFLASSYTSAEKADGSIAWEAKQKSKENGDIAWHGELQGDTMTGTLIWKQPDGKTAQYAMYGSAVVPEEGEASAPEKSTASETSTTSESETSSTVPESASESAPASKSWWGCSLVRSSMD
jgi:hypothetical protein